MIYLKSKNLAAAIEELGALTELTTISAPLVYGDIVDNTATFVQRNIVKMTPSTVTSAWNDDMIGINLLIVNNMANVNNGWTIDKKISSQSPGLMMSRSSGTGNIMIYTDYLAQTASNTLYVENSGDIGFAVLKNVQDVSQYVGSGMTKT